MNYDLVAVEAEQTINGILYQYIERFCFNRSDRRKALTTLMEASQLPELDYDGIKLTVVRLSDTMRSIEMDSTGDISEMAKWRKAIDQISSIMHISRAYPKDAMKRLKRLRDMPVKAV